MHAWFRNVLVWPQERFGDGNSGRNGWVKERVRIILDEKMCNVREDAFSDDWWSVLTQKHVYHMSKTKEELWLNHEVGNTRRKN